MTVNGSNPTLIMPDPGPSLTKEQQDCVDVLSNALEEALKGNITTVGVVACFLDGIAATMAGKNGAALNIACDHLKRQIYGAMFEDGNVAPRRSSIVRTR